MSTRTGPPWMSHPRPTVVILSRSRGCIIAVAIERVLRAQQIHTLRSSRKRTRNARNVNPRTRAARRRRRTPPSCESVLLRPQIRHFVQAQNQAHSNLVRISWRRSAHRIITVGCARRANTTTRGKTGTLCSRDPICTGLRATLNRCVSRRLSG